MKIPTIYTPTIKVQQIQGNTYYNLFFRDKKVGYALVNQMTDCETQGLTPECTKWLRLEYLHVDQDHRKRGYGGFLVDKVTELGRHEKNTVITKPKVFGFGDNRLDLSQLIEFFKRHGFSQYEANPDFLVYTLGGGRK